MAETEAQRKASSKYKAENVRQVKVNIFPKDLDVYNHIKSKPRISEYIISLVRQDMSRS